MWEQEFCEQCLAVNWIDHGDLNDLTVEERTGFYCWHCKHETVLVDEAFLDGDGYTIEGVQCPD